MLNPQNVLIGLAFLLWTAATVAPQGGKVWLVFLLLSVAVAGVVFVRAVVRGVRLAAGWSPRASR